MLRTIMIGSCISVQGIQVGESSDGRVTISVGDNRFVGYPVAGKVRN